MLPSPSRRPFHGYATPSEGWQGGAVILRRENQWGARRSYPNREVRLGDLLMARLLDGGDDVVVQTRACLQIYLVDDYARL